MKALFEGFYSKCLPLSPTDAVIDITGDWRRLQVRKAGSLPVTASLPAQEVKTDDALPTGSLCGFLPIDILHYLDTRFSSLVHDSRKPEDKCTIWVVSDDGSIPLIEKTDTRIKRSIATKKNLEKHGKSKVSYTDVERVDDNYIVRKSGTFDSDPIITDIFCSSSSRDFRIQVLQWIIKRAATFPWKKGASFELIFLFEGCTPTRVTPMYYGHPVVQGQLTDISDLKGIAFPEKKFAEADLLIPCLVPFIANARKQKLNSDDPVNCNVVVSVIDSDVLALMISVLMKESSRQFVDTSSVARETKTGHSNRKLNVVFARPGYEEFIDVNGIAEYLLAARIDPNMFLGFCIASGTDFFPRSHALYGVGCTIPLQTLFAIASLDSDARIRFDPRTRDGFVELLSAVALFKDKSRLWKSKEYRTLEGVREAYTRVLCKNIPKYAPTKDLFDMSIADRRNTADPDPSLLDFQSVFDVFKFNMDYWLGV